MRRRFRLLAPALAGLLIAASVWALQISDYPSAKRTFPRGKPPPQRRYLPPDMPMAEVKKYMEEMSRSIGAKCVLCHNESDYTSWEKPMREFAQAKMGMMAWLNDKYRPPTATWRYTCYTCHRGELKPLPSTPPAAGKSR